MTDPETMTWEYQAQAEPGTYPATVKAVEPVTLDTREGSKDLIRWTLEGVTVDGEVFEVDALSSRNTSNRAKGVKWLRALGRAPSQGKPTRPEDLAGLPCLIVVGANDDGDMTLEDIIPAPKTAK